MYRLTDTEKNKRTEEKTNKRTGRQRINGFKIGYK